MLEIGFHQPNLEGQYWVNDVDAKVDGTRPLYQPEGSVADPATALWFIGVCVLGKVAKFTRAPELGHTERQELGLQHLLFIAPESFKLAWLEVCLHKGIQI